MVNLKTNPFFLDDEDIRWVEDTLSSMTLEEKIGQLFCPIGFSTDPAALLPMLNKGVAGMMFRPGPGAEIQEIHRFLQANAKIPLLLAANLEAGGTGMATDGTNFGKPMQAAATGNPEQGYRLGYVACSEGAAVGCNWSFAPIVDIDRNWRNPITNLRTFGSDPETVLRMSAGYLRGAKDAGCAVSIKHFPGDGVDERDQHLHLTVNSLDCQTWMDTYGKIYQGLIDQGAQTVMVGHIAQPAWATCINSLLTREEAYLPATLSEELLNGLLRKRLHFNGMIVSDATPMCGFTTAMEREKAVPACIARGVDLFLFNKDFQEDYDFMLQGYRDGILTGERLTEALTRILATKAALWLHRKQREHSLVPGSDALAVLKNERFTQWANECADQSVTLVKDTQNLLPITPEKYRRVMLVVMDGGDFYGKKTDLLNTMREELKNRGFEVFDAPDGSYVMNDRPMTVRQYKESFDLALYVFDLPTASNNTVVRLSWKGFLGGGNTPWFVRELPVMAISLANPYHLIDVPQIKTFVNAYTNSEYTVSAVLDKITGLSRFKGISPVDPFCDRVDTTL